MPASAGGEIAVNRLWPLLLPELRQFPPTDQDSALRTARHTELDILELLGMAAGLVAVTALTRYTLPSGSIGARFLFVLLNAVVAIPLLMLALGPFHIRRLRRGLRKQLQDRQVP
jgi:hypothetical protein